MRIERIDRTYNICLDSTSFTVGEVTYIPLKLLATEEYNEYFDSDKLLIKFIAYKNGKKFEIERAGTPIEMNRMFVRFTMKNKSYVMDPRDGDISSLESFRLHKRVIKNRQNNKYATLNYFLNSDEKFRYQMLGRLQHDCLGAYNGGRLWTNSIDDMILYMKALYNSVKIKPDWISIDEINKYEAELKNLEQQKF